MNSHSAKTATDLCLTSSKTSDAQQCKYTAFLCHLAESSNVTNSARLAGLTPGSVYQKRRQDPGFARKWLAALYEGYLHLEMEVLHRLREGEMQGNNADKYDFANAIRLLSAHRENAARAQAQQRNVTAAEVRASIDRKVEAIKQQVQEEKARESKPR